VRQEERGALLKAANEALALARSTQREAARITRLTSGRAGERPLLSEREGASGLASLVARLACSHERLAEAVRALAEAIP
jgi:hypothetical protein